MRRFSHYQDKPPIGYRLNPAHPLASWVVDAMFCQEFGGAPSFLFGGQSLAIRGTPTWGQTGFIVNATGASATVTTPDRLRITQPMTICWQGRMLATPATNATMFDWTFDNIGSSQPFNVCTFAWDGSKYLCWYGNINNRVVNDASTLSTAGRQQLVLAGNANNVTLYRNGTQSNVAAVGINPTFASTSQIGFGTCTGTGVGGLNSAHTSDFAIIFNRQLTQTQVQLIWTDPYDLLEPFRPRSRSVAAVLLSRRVGQRARIAGMSGGLAG